MLVNISALSKNGGGVLPDEFTLQLPGVLTFASTGQDIVRYTPASTGTVTIGNTNYIYTVTPEYVRSPLQETGGTVNVVFTYKFTKK